MPPSPKQPRITDNGAAWAWLNRAALGNGSSRGGSARIFADMGATAPDEFVLGLDANDVAVVEAAVPCARSGVVAGDAEFAAEDARHLAVAVASSMEGAVGLEAAVLKNALIAFLLVVSANHSIVFGDCGAQIPPVALRPAAAANIRRLVAYFVRVASRRGPTPVQKASMFARAVSAYTAALGSPPVDLPPPILQHASVHSPVSSACIARFLDGAAACLGAMVVPTGFVSPNCTTNQERYEAAVRLGETAADRTTEDAVVGPLAALAGMAPWPVRGFLATLVAGICQVLHAVLRSSGFYGPVGNLLVKSLARKSRGAHRDDSATSIIPPQYRDNVRFLTQPHAVRDQGNAVVAFVSAQFYLGCVRVALGDPRLHQDRRGLLAASRVAVSLALPAIRALRRDMSGLRPTDIVLRAHVIKVFSVLPSFDVGPFVAGWARASLPMAREVVASVAGAGCTVAWSLLAFRAPDLRPAIADAVVRCREASVVSPWVPPDRARAAPSAGPATDYLELSRSRLGAAAQRPKPPNSAQIRDVMARARCASPLEWQTVIRGIHRGANVFYRMMSQFVLRGTGAFCNPYATRYISADSWPLVVFSVRSLDARIFDTPSVQSIREYTRVGRLSLGTGLPVSLDRDIRAWEHQIVHSYGRYNKLSKTDAAELCRSKENSLPAAFADALVGAIAGGSCACSAMAATCNSIRAHVSPLCLLGDTRVVFGVFYFMCTSMSVNMAWSSPLFMDHSVFVGSLQAPVSAIDAAGAHASGFLRGVASRSLSPSCIAVALLQHAAFLPTHRHGAHAFGEELGWLISRCVTDATIIVAADGEAVPDRRSLVVEVAECWANGRSLMANSIGAVCATAMAEAGAMPPGGFMPVADFGEAAFPHLIRSLTGSCSDSSSSDDDSGSDSDSSGDEGQSDSEH